MKILLQRKSPDWELIGFEAARATRDIEKAKAICAQDLSAHKLSFQPDINDLSRHIPAREAQRDALCDQLYDPDDPVSDREVQGRAFRLKLLACLFAGVLFTSVAAHIYRFLLLGIGVIICVAVGIFLTIAAATAGHLAFEKLLQNSKLAQAVVIALAAFLMFWGLFQLAQAGAIAIAKTEAGANGSGSYVDEPENQHAAEAEAPPQSDQKRAEELLAGAVTKIFLSADVMLGLLLATVVRMRADEKYATWRKIEACDQEIAHMKKMLDIIDAQIEIAERKCMAGILRFFYAERKQHPTYFRRTAACVALVLFVSIANATASGQNITRQEGILIDVSGSIGQGGANNPLFREYLIGTRQLLLTEPPNSRVVVLRITTESFGSSGELLKCWTPGTRGVFTDDLDRARRQLAAAFESKGTRLSPIAAGTDIIGALWRMKTLLESASPNAAPGEREIWIFSDMVNETPALPMPALLPGGADNLLEHANVNGLVVPLKGYKVRVAGASTRGLSPQAWKTIKAFWTAYFGAAGAELVSYSPEAAVQR